MKIALFWPNWIGDAVMATPAARALRLRYPRARFVAVLKPYVAGVLEGSPWLDETVYLDSRGPWARRWPAAAQRLRGAGIEKAVLFPNTLRSALTAYVGKCGERIGFDRHGRGRLLTHRLDPVRDGEGQLVPSPVVDDYNRLAVAAGCPKPSRRLELFTTPRDEAEADRVWNAARLERYSEVVCLNPGAAFGSAKHWLPGYFAALARKLTDRRGCGVLVLCGPNEAREARQIAIDARRPGVFALPAPWSIGLTKACIKRASLLVTTDSGPRHFASAFGTPVVTLFGPTHIQWTETYFPQAIHLQKQVPCGPCQLRVCPIDHGCMKTLMPWEVYDAAVELLGRERRRLRLAAA